jgi:hypothetical protein
MAKILPAHIQDKISPEPNSGCWLWTAAIDGSGYGVTSDSGKTVSAHRAVYRLLVGEILDGMHLDHLCRVRCCVNPLHLEPVTPRVNLLRGKTIASARASQAHCINGHELAGENLYTRGDRGTRECRACRSEAARRYGRKAA